MRILGREIENIYIFADNIFVCGKSVNKCERGPLGHVSNPLTCEIEDIINVIALPLQF